MNPVDPDDDGDEGHGNANGPKNTDILSSMGSRDQSERAKIGKGNAETTPPLTPRPRGKLTDAKANARAMLPLVDTIPTKNGRELVEI